jgi:hypothetical protein
VEERVAWPWPARHHPERFISSLTTTLRFRYGAERGDGSVATASRGDGRVLVVFGQPSFGRTAVRAMHVTP